jgi:hypothetical protein
MTPRPYRVRLSTGTVELYARTTAQAVSAPLELAEPGAGVAWVGEW